MGTIQVGTKAFAILIQGFASTGFGITVAIVGRSYLMISTKGETNETVKVLHLHARRKRNSGRGMVDKKES